MSSSTSAPPLEVRRSWVPEAIAGAGLLTLAVSSAVLVSMGTGEEGVTRVARYTARLAFLFFLPPFLASAMATLWPSARTRALVRERRALGLAFGTVHTIHMFSVIAVFQSTDQSLAGDPSNFVGGAAFALMLAMMATSNDASVRALGRKRWRALHVTGLFSLWGIFTFSYGGRVAASQSTLR